MSRGLEMALDRVLTGRMRRNEPLHRHTSVRIGGPASYFIEPASGADIRSVRRLALEWRVPCTVIGKGSNILVSDAGIPGIVISLGQLMSRLEWSGETEAFVESGLSLPRLAKLAADRGLAGIEFGSGIPGTVGGGVVMNAGAHGGEMSDIVRRVHVIDAMGEYRVFDRDELDFAYRRSRFSQNDEHVVIGADLSFIPENPEVIRERMKGFARQRRTTQPLGRPSSGSVFKNPPGDYAGRLIQAAGLKGERIGQAQVSPVHGNFIVNCGGATADDVMRLIDHVRDRVQRAFGVELQLEVELIGM